MYISKRITIVDSKPTIKVKFNNTYRIERALVDTGAVLPICTVDSKTLNDAGLLTNPIGMLKINGFGGPGYKIPFYKMSVVMDQLCFIDIPVGVDNKIKRSFQLALPYTMFASFDIAFINSRNSFELSNDEVIPGVYQTTVSVSGMTWDYSILYQDIQ